MNSILSIFIDELGNFNMHDHHGALYGFCLVLHDQSAPINEHLDKLHASLTSSGYDASLPLHTAPIIRMKDPYDTMDREERRVVFNKFFNCAKRLPIKYKTFIFEKDLFDTKMQLIAKMIMSLKEFIEANRDVFSKYSLVRVYYDNGQQEISSMIHSVFNEYFDKFVEFKKALPSQYRLLQVADLFCTLEAIEYKRMKENVNKSEIDFFVSMNKFKKTYLRSIRSLSF